MAIDISERGMRGMRDLVTDMGGDPDTVDATVYEAAWCAGRALAVIAPESVMARMAACGAIEGVLRASVHMPAQTGR